MGGITWRRLAVLAVAAGVAGCVGQSYPVTQPVAQAARPSTQFVLAADVLFPFDSAVLQPDASAQLSQILASIRQTYPYPAIRVEGYTDSIGTDVFNDDLSLRRANAVRDWLVGAGIPPAVITTVGFGKRNPVAPNTLPTGADSPDGRAHNRRVVLVASPA